MPELSTRCYPSNRISCPIVDFAISPNGKLIAVALDNSDSDGVQVWDRVTGNKVFGDGGQQWFAGTAHIYFSACGTKVIALGENGLLGWHYASAKRVLSHQVNFSHMVQRTDNSALCAVRMDSSSLFLLDIDDINAAWIIATFNSPIKSVCCSDDVVAAACSDGTIQIYQISTGKVRILEIETRALALSSDARQLAAVGPAGLVVLDVASGVVLSRFVAEKGYNSVAYSPADDCIAVLASDDYGYKNEVGLFDTQTHKVRPLAGHFGDIFRLAFSPDGKFLFGGGEDCVLLEWCVNSARESGTLIGHGGRISTLAISPDSQYLATGGEDARVMLWSILDGSLVNAFAEYRFCLRRVAFSVDGTLLLAADEGSIISLWDIKKSAELCSIKPQSYFADDPGVVEDVALSPDNRLIVAVFGAQRIVLWNIANQTLTTTIQQHEYGANKVAFLDSSTFVTADHQGRVTQWHIGQNSEPVEWTASSSDNAVNIRPVATSRYTSTMSSSQTVLAISQDGRKVAFDTDTEFLVIWDVVTAKATHSFISIGTDSTEFSFDGSHIASPMGIFDLKKRFCRLEYECRGEATAAAFSRDNSFHVVADNDWIARYGKHDAIAS